MGRKLVGIRLWKGSRQAYVEVHGKTYAKSFPLTTPLEEVRQWREDERKARRKEGPAAGTFAADVLHYLARVRAMPTFAQRAAHLQLWAEALDGGRRSRHAVTAAEVDAVMQHWLLTPTAPAKGRPSGPQGIAPATVRKRRTSLLSFYQTMNGRQAGNPVKDTRGPRPPKPELLALDYPTIERILAAMPNWQCVKRGTPRQRNLTKLRAAVLAYTGLPPGLLATVTPFDLDLKAKTLRVRPRRKGAGVEARTLQLTADGVAACRAFHHAEAYGPFSVSAANVSFKRAAKRIGLVGPTLYALRHSHGTLLYRVTGDLATVARFMLHASLSSTARYAQGAMQDVDTEAARKAGAVLHAVRLLSRSPVPREKRHAVK